jgi:5'-methylthioadenosine phosphorylase
MPGGLSVIGIIGGTSLLSSAIFRDWDKEPVATPYGRVEVRLQGASAFLQRHGNPPMPPHRINHRGNISALAALKVDHILAINSVGSLRLAIRPGSFVIPDDFVSPWQIPTFFDDEMRFTVPRMDQNLGRSLYDRCRREKIKARAGGVYIQTVGPRLETRAEIAMLKRFGHVVGMTMAAEATLSMERGIPYASLCSIDNYCNGIVEVPLTMEQIHENAVNNSTQIERLIRSAVRKGLL